MQCPSKRIAVGVLIRDQRGRLLLVKPGYREGWLIPGGVVDADESPRAGLIREVREELGLSCTPERLLCVDYVRAAGDYGDGLHLLFAGEVLTSAQAATVRICDPELTALCWATPSEALQLLVPSLARRLASLRGSGFAQTLYLEDGQAAG
ncbi:MAG: NUDIX domain-containing protein [Pseudomonas sp.]